MIPPKVRAEVLERDGRQCRRCGAMWAPRWSIHHRLPRRMGGTKDPRSNDPRNLVLLCGSGTEGCHGYIEAHRAIALHEGWLIASYDDLDRPMLPLHPSQTEQQETA